MIAPAAMLAARILIVDEQPVNVRLLEQILRQAGYENVTSTTDAETACALHRRDHYDLILLDPHMPGMDGARPIEALEAIDGDACLPVLVTTARPCNATRALPAGAKDFIGRPFDVVEVKTRIHNLLEARLLCRRVRMQGQELEAAVRERTAELRESEARYRSLTELASDWYWEQDADGAFTKTSGPVLEMLGLQADPLAGAGGSGGGSGWNQVQHQELRAAIAARQPFLDFVFTRTNPDGTMQKFQVSGEPMFGPGCEFVGYRGIGFEITGRKQG